MGRGIPIADQTHPLREAEWPILWQPGYIPGDTDRAAVFKPYLLEVMEIYFENVVVAKLDWVAGHRHGGSVFVFMDDLTVQPGRAKWRMQPGLLHL